MLRKPLPFDRFLIGGALRWLVATGAAETEDAGLEFFFELAVGEPKASPPTDLGIGLWALKPTGRVPVFGFDFVKVLESMEAGGIEMNHK
jgi:hypothetical protein